MSFVSFYFLLFLAAVFLAYYLTPAKYRWVVLLAASYIFYALNGIKLLFLIVLTTCTVFFTGIAIDKINSEQKALFEGKDKDWLGENSKRHKGIFAGKKKRAVAFSLLFNFGILALFKYLDYFAEFFNMLMPKMSVPLELPYLNLLLPLGISFYTFQSLGYIIDVYRGKYPADRNLAKFALFVSFFPQIVQGPISRYDQLAHQLTGPNRFDFDEFKYGVQLIVWGFFKKLVIADRIAILVNGVVPNYTQYEGVQVWFAVFLYTVQVYADFSGGMDIARGVARCLGIDLVRNFERPFFSTSIADYWRRWHITLGAWMREYLLYSITFSKRYARYNKWVKTHLGQYWGKVLPACMPMMIVFLAIGVWHGAGLKYIAFGVYNGVLIVLGILLSVPLQNARNKYPRLNTSIPALRILTVIGVAFLVVIGRYFTVSDGMRQAMQMIKSSFSVFNPSALFGDYFVRAGLGYNNLAVLLFALALLFIVSFLQERGVNIRETFGRQNIVLRWLAYYFVLFVIILLGIYGTGDAEFIYQRF